MTPITITNERINSFGYRLLTDGGDVTDYLKNPILLYDHVRRQEGHNDKDIILPIGKLNDLKKEGGAWVAVPEFDQDDEFANKVASKFLKGYLNAASVGIEIIEISEDPELMEKGQTLPTVTKWKLREVSITDIPANADAVKLSYQGKTMLLNGKQDADEVKSFFNKTPIQNMKKLIALLNATKLVALHDTAPEGEVEAAIGIVTAKLSAKDAEIAEQGAEIARLKKEAADAKVAGLKDRATTMVEAALSAKKIVAGQKDSYITLASASEEGYNATKAILDGMKGYEPVMGLIKSTDLSGKSKKELAEMYNKLHREGGLEDLKANDPEEYKLVYKAKFNKEPKP